MATILRGADGDDPNILRDLASQKRYEQRTGGTAPALPEAM